MMPNTWRERPVPWIVVTVSLLIGATALAFFSIQEEDIFWHLAAGNWMLANRHFAPADAFVYTVPAGRPWIDVQWAFQILSAAIWKTGGWNGLIVARIGAVLGLTLVLLGWARERLRDPLIAFVAIASLLLAIRFRFWYRPELLTFALSAAHVFLYDSFYRTGRFRGWLLVLLQLFWGNWHSSSVLGIILAGIFCSERLLAGKALKPQGEPRGETSVAISIPVCFLAAMCLASMANPFGWRTIAYALTEGQKKYVQEFQAPTYRFLISASGIYLALALIGAWRSVKERNLFLLISAVAFGAEGTRMIRFFPYFGIVIFPLAADGCRAIHGALIRKAGARTGVPLFAFAAACWLSVGILITYSTERRRSFHGGLDDSQSPVAAADFVLAEKPTGNIYNEFSHGGYLVWRFSGNPKVFIFNDTLLNGEILERVQRTGPAEEWRRLLDQFHVDVAIVPVNVLRPGNGVRSLGSMLAEWKDWRLVFWDDQTCIFVRETQANSALVARSRKKIFPESLGGPDTPWIDSTPFEKLARDEKTWRDIKGELEGVVATSPAHYRASYALAIGYTAREEFIKAIACYEDAARIAPNFAALHARLGALYYQTGDETKGRAAFERSARLSSSRHDALYNMAIAQYKSGHKEDAIATLEGILVEDPSYVRSLRLLKQIQTPASSGEISPDP